jgi:RNA polymerase sigma-70 factor (ECF subfamily)
MSEPTGRRQAPRASRRGAGAPWTEEQSEPTGRGAAWTEEQSEPTGRGAAWTEERSDEGRRRLQAPRRGAGEQSDEGRRRLQGAPQASRQQSAQDFLSLRPLMFSIAYRMLGSVADAEDIVQEAFLRYHRASSQAGRPESPKAYLSAVTTRLCIDHARSARVRRESYVGEWLPEPLLTGPAAPAGPVAGAGPASPAPLAVAQVAPDPADLAERADSLSMAFLLVLERLSPVERAVFLLHDVFSYSYDETAAIVGKSEANCRQLAHRARQHVTEHRPRQESSRHSRDELAGRFFAAVDHGDMDGLVELLAADVEVHGDSGGVRPSWPRPIIGRDRVSRLLIGLMGQARTVGAVLAPTEVNGQPGALFLDAEGRLISVLTVDIADGVVQMVRSVISRDKLRHLGPLADIGGMLAELRKSGGPSSAPPAG